jgi:hydroxymethylbilane synthase
MAGLNRLGRSDVAQSALDPSDMLPAIAQGAIGIERRANDTRAAEMLSAIHDEMTGQQLAAERAFLKALDGSCETPIAGLAVLNGTTLHLRGEVLRPDGSDSIKDARSAPIADGAAQGRAMAADMLKEAGPGFFDWR